MEIDNKTYPLTQDNYIPIECVKTQIILAQTFNHDMKHVIGWKNRVDGKTKKTAAFTIDTNGLIYNHFDSKYLSKFFNDLDINKKSIVILIENDGWLNKNDKNEFITWVGDIYNNVDDVVKKKWRGHIFWAPYNNKQLESALYLVNKLCDEYFIPKTVPSHNTKMDLLDYHGVLYKSNISKHYSDLNPTWDFSSFKNKLEKYGK